jgi:hypothetical protein
MVVPLAEPPVGTRGLPFLDRFFSGEVGNSQFPAFIAVLENGRRLIEAFFEQSVPLLEGKVKAEIRGRRGVEDNESRSN